MKNRLFSVNNRSEFSYTFCFTKQSGSNMWSPSKSSRELLIMAGNFYNAGRAKLDTVKANPLWSMSSRQWPVLWLLWLGLNLGEKNCDFNITLLQNLQTACRASFIQPYIQPPIHPSIHWFIHSLIHPSIHPFLVSILFWSGSCCHLYFYN